ncbi:hemolysin activation/secretion protein [Sphingomonas vulcanisoli]|uniref:Hemolysin activation/secretion protein n=1 Tax=Sphingomonas vulcanisoli TaxID=1658060 RepID=A0ABX0TMJ3_9SPHN|nr:hypothetical protein [Sphingomonas vulcanisoli]NIJ06742.1 hemolysin activation/secretion protein [Sphingomonas vulcanisoli]
MQPFAGNQISADLIFSKGITGLGARTTASVLASDTPTSRGSDPQFATLEARLEVDQALPAGFGIAVIARGQASFGTTVPNAYSFDLSGLDSLSSFTAGNLSSDGGAVLRSELSRPVPLSHRKLRLLATPYAYAAIGRAHYVFADPLNPDWARSYGIGLHFAAQGLPLGAGLNASVEYGHSHLANGVAPGDRLSVSFGVQF